MSKAKNGNSVKVHYKGTLDDGTVFDNSHDRGETLDFELGAKRLLPDFEEAVVGMAVGDTKSFRIVEGYGTYNPEAVVKVPREAFPPDFAFEVGTAVQGTSPTGQPLVAKINSVTDTEVELDHNHPLAGKDLNFEVELVEIA